MGKFIRIKEVEAHRMKAAEAIEKGYEIDDHEENEMGYEVEDEDGSKSWCPERIFEPAYRPSETPLDRLYIEINDLEKKLSKLEIFMKGETYKDLSLDMKASLLLQQNIMRRYVHQLYYRDVLMRRLNENDAKTKNILSFNEAFVLLKEGYMIRRKHWADKGISIIKQIPMDMGTYIDSITKLPQSIKDKMTSCKEFTELSNQCVIYDETTDKTYLYQPTMSDVFAYDWEIVL